MFERGSGAASVVTSGRGRIAELDGWRGISIACVVVGHMINIRYSADPHAASINPASVLSNWGVRVFFIISGFIIVRLAIQEKISHAYFSIKRFYVRRFFRIVPAFYFYLLSIAIFTWFGLINQRGYGTALAAVFVCNVPGMPCDWFAGHSWTLSFEEQFYLVFPLIFCWSGRYFPKALLAIFTALLVFPFIRYGLSLQDPWYVAGSMCPAFSFICIGAVAATYEPRIKQLATGRYGTTISIACGLFLIATGTLNSTIALPLGSPEAYIQAAITNIFLPLSLAWTVLNPVFRHSYLGALLRDRVVQFLGLISYSLYLWQEVFTANIIYYPRDSWLLFPPLMLVAATLSYHWIERPCIEAGRWLLAKDRKFAAALAEPVIGDG